MKPTHIIKEIGPRSAWLARREQLEGQKCQVVLDSTKDGTEGWFMGKVIPEHWPSNYSEQMGYVALFQAKLEPIE